MTRPKFPCYVGVYMKRWLTEISEDLLNNVLVIFFSKIGSPPKTPVSQAAATSAGPPNIGTEVNSVPPKSSPFVPRVPVYPPHSDNVQYFQDPRTQLSYEVPQYPQTGEWDEHWVKNCSELFSGKAQMLRNRDRNILYLFCQCLFYFIFIKYQPNLHLMEY